MCKYANFHSHDAFLAWFTCNIYKFIDYCLRRRENFLSFKFLNIERKCSVIFGHCAEILYVISLTYGALDLPSSPMQNIYYHFERF